MITNTAAAPLLFAKLVGEVGSTKSTVTYPNSAVAIALGTVFLDEPFTVGITVGSVLVLLGAALATWRSRPLSFTRTP